MSVLKLKRVDMGRANPNCDQPVWIREDAIERFELESGKAYSILTMRSGGSTVPVREKAIEIAALMGGAVSSAGDVVFHSRVEGVWPTPALGRRVQVLFAMHGWKTPAVGTFVRLPDSERWAGARCSEDGTEVERVELDATPDWWALVTVP